MEESTVSKMERVQTAVEWLEQQIKQTYDNEGKLPIAYMLDLIKQAKQMEKRQIMESWLDGDNDGSLEPKAFEKIAEEYYKEKYNK